jgi:alkylhydroperoxidase/carboxymuconolactone decarboxylase family protein YurZ
MTALILGYLLSVAPHQAVLPHLAVLVALGADSCFGYHIITASINQ